MIATLRGILTDKTAGHVVLEAGGVGYEVAVGASTASRLPGPGGEAELFISESTAMYGGGTTLYGFLTREEKQMFLALRELPNTGAKKALDLLEKASRSLPEFRRAVLEEDARMLTDIFGFTKKTADRLLNGLREKLGGLPAGGRTRKGVPATAPMTKALEALASLGYRNSECRTALEEVQRELAGKRAPVEEIIRLALRKL